VSQSRAIANNGICLLAVDAGAHVSEPASRTSHWHDARVNTIRVAAFSGSQRPAEQVRSLRNKADQPRLVPAKSNARAFVTCDSAVCRVLPCAVCLEELQSRGGAPGVPQALVPTDPVFSSNLYFRWH
jgi:hypothetical protein